MVSKGTKEGEREELVRFEVAVSGWTLRHPDFEPGYGIKIIVGSLKSLNLGMSCEFGRYRKEKCMGSVRTMEFGFYVIEDSSLGGKGK